jgi:hypothetical protein
VKGLLDDAYELAVQLRDTLQDAADQAADEPWAQRTFGHRAAPAQELANTADELDDIANRIDRQRTALRGS